LEAVSQLNKNGTTTVTITKEERNEWKEHSITTYSLTIPTRSSLSTYDQIDGHYRTWLLGRLGGSIEGPLPLIAGFVYQNPFKEHAIEIGLAVKSDCGCHSSPLSINGRYILESTLK
jgi:hypothetical protein